MRALLTDIWEDDHDGRRDDTRAALAVLVVPPDAVESVLQPLEH